MSISTSGESGEAKLNAGNFSIHEEGTEKGTSTKEMFDAQGEEKNFKMTRATEKYDDGFLHFVKDDNLHKGISSMFIDLDDEITQIDKSLKGTFLNKDENIINLDLSTEEKISSTILTTSDIDPWKPIGVQTNCSDYISSVCDFFEVNWECDSTKNQSGSGESEILKPQNSFCDQIPKKTSDKLPNAEKTNAEDSFDLSVDDNSFFVEEDGDFDDLPYISETLPVEKSVTVHITPIKERNNPGSIVITKPLLRPRCFHRPNPASLDDYISTSPDKINNSKSTETKMKIVLPLEDREDPFPDSIPETIFLSPKKNISTSWSVFAQLGVRNPRETRKQMIDKNDDTGDLIYRSYLSNSNSNNTELNKKRDKQVEVLQIHANKFSTASDLDSESNKDISTRSFHQDQDNVAPPVSNWVARFPE